MTQYAQYYEENLYPLQDKILKTVNKLSSPFYLTDGTALSRGYFHHRYSDDLDFFANGIDDFKDLSAEAIKAIRELPSVSLVPSFTIVSDTFIGMMIKSDDGTMLKIDFVNDIPYRNGKPSVHGKLGNLDSLENILTNKISALIGRTEMKDIADLWRICKGMPFKWKDAINKALNKEACIDSLMISAILTSISEKDFDAIRWIDKPDFVSFENDLSAISRDLLEEKENSLSRRKTRSKSI